MTLHVAALLVAAATGRDVVSFDFGWKHRNGLHDWAGADDPPEDSPDPGMNPPEAQSNFSEATWVEVQLPHDAVVSGATSGAACPYGCSGFSYLPRHVLWYRKTFTIPADWQGSAFWLDFQGSFRLTTVWINGEYAGHHDCGYTPFRIRLDNMTSVNVGDKNLITVFVDPDNGDEGAVDHGSGWWYEGGGIYRSLTLVRSDAVHVEQDGLFAYSNVTLQEDQGASAELHASAAVYNSGTANAKVCVKFNLTDPNGSSVVVSDDQVLEIPAGTVLPAKASLQVPSVQLWNSASPTLYTVSASVHADCCDDTCKLLDLVSDSHGFRSLRFDANEGFLLNEEHFKVRGFCDHNSFAVVGMAVPERVNLFRAQASRAVGGNGRRTSHNPPNPDMLDIYDRIGVVVMDENRLFANETRYVNNMGVMVKRDRNHPSVVIWSFCNEDGCGRTGDPRQDGGPRFREISYQMDGSRPTLANMFDFGNILSDSIDVQGFSHQDRDTIDQCHEQLPDKAIWESECCSCNTFRDEDEGNETIDENPHVEGIQKSFNARCAEHGTNASDGASFAVGTMVWTLFDYYGEPPVRDPGASNPEVVGTYGQYDVCGFPKAAAFWYRTQWLLTIPDGPDKTFPTQGRHEVHLVESWESPDSFPSTVGNKNRSIHAYSSAPAVELFVNGKSQGIRAVVTMNQGLGSYAEWTDVPWEAGVLTAVARDATGTAVAQDERKTNGVPAKLELSLDAPSKLTGTGEALVLDGQDAALLRASIKDAAGEVVHLASNNVSFRIVSGPGRIQGTHNGNIHSHGANNLTWHEAYHGLVRAVVRVTSAAGRRSKERQLLSQIDEIGLMASGAVEEDPADAIVVEASSPGFDPVQVSIPVSTDLAKHGVMAAAASAAGQPVDFFGKQPIQSPSVQFV